MDKTRGHSYPIRRTPCHITIVLKDISKDHIWIKKKKRWIEIYTKYTDIRKRYFDMIDRDRLKLNWANRESEDVWDKK